MNNEYPPLSIFYKYHYMMILSFRNKNIKGSKNELASEIGVLTTEERLFLTKWQYFSTVIPPLLIEHYTQYSADELVKYFTVLSRHQFPIPTSELRSSWCCLILSYYWMLGLDITPKKIIFTDQQKSVVEQKEGICVVNAGPGTGKTTTANEKAYQLSSEGVLLVSYTNEAINENYNRLHYYPKIKSIIGKKKYPRKLTVTTADSLASYVLGGIITDNYDDTVINATTILKTDIKFPYNHLIIDEAQDINEIRGTFLKTLYTCGHVKSITIFGDPRQRLDSKAGKWYQDLWINGEVKKVGFTQTHRFVNEGLLNLANHLSLQRPELHVELHNTTLENTIPIKLWHVQYNNQDSDLIRLSKYLKQLNQKGLSYNDIVVIGPSINRDNQTSKTGKRICAVFKDQDIPCYTTSEGSYLPSGIRFSTIHSIKGKEYRVVIIFGMYDFPNTFKEIPYEEADSLIYVAHTRAKQKIIYLGDNPFCLPRHVPENFIEMKKSNKLIKTRQTEKSLTTMYFPISDVSESHDFRKLIKTNSGSIEIERIDVIPPKVGPAQFDSRLWGVFCGLGVEMFLINDYFSNIRKLAAKQYICVKDKEYRTMVSNGEIFRGFRKDGVLIINQESMVNALLDDERKELVRILTVPLEQLTWNEWKILVITYDFLVGGHMNSRYDLRLIKNVNVPDFKSIADWLKNTYGEVKEVEGNVRFSYLLGQYDAYLNETLFEFKTSSKDTPSMSYQLQTIMYDSCLPSKEKIIYNLENGALFRVSSSKSKEWWLHLMQSYAIIRNHITYTEWFRSLQIRKKKIIPEIKDNIYTCDTEFIPHDEKIFDLAYVNVYDPYKSIVQMLNPGERNIRMAIDWISEHTEDWSENKLNNLLINSPDNVINLLNQLNPNSTFYYYICGIDVKPITNPLSIKINIAPSIRDISKHHGANLQSGSPPKLGDIYGKIVFPIEFQDYLQIHTALSDALLLYTFIKCGFLNI
jgi:hypothetical protein